jgi:hypothetical protein
MKIISCGEDPIFLDEENYKKSFLRVQDHDIISYAAADDKLLLPLFSQRCDEKREWWDEKGESKGPLVFMHVIALEDQSGVWLLGPSRYRIRPNSLTLGRQRELLRELESGKKAFANIKGGHFWNLERTILDYGNGFPELGNKEDGCDYDKRLFQFICERYASVAKENCEKLGLPFLIAEKILDNSMEVFSERAHKRNQAKKNDLIRDDPKIIEYKAAMERYKQAIEEREKQICSDLFDSVEVERQYYISIANQRAGEKRM